MRAVAVAAVLVAASTAAAPGWPSYREFRASAAADGDQPPPDVQIRWMAPFTSGGGYCSEAMAFAQGFRQLGRGYFSGEPHGDSTNYEYLNGLPGLDKALLNDVLGRTGTGAPVIAVCHSEPGAWHLPPAHPQRYSTSVCPPPYAAYKVGRTMFESDRLPDGWAERLNAMDEVWVPTDYSRAVFEAGGVDPTKLVVVPEAVDADFFDPKSMQPVINLPGVPLRAPHHCPPPLLGTDVAIPAAPDDASAAAAEPPWPHHGDIAALTLGTSPSCPFRFLSVGKWERRKNFEALLRAYFSEFMWHDDDVVQPAATTIAAGETASTTAPVASGVPPHVELYILTSAYHSTSDFASAVREVIATQLVCGTPASDEAIMRDHGDLLAVDGAAGNATLAAACAVDAGGAIVDAAACGASATARRKRRHPPCIPPEALATEGAADAPSPTKKRRGTGNKRAGFFGKPTGVGDPISIATAGGWHLPPVSLLHDVPQQEMPRLYGAMDAFVSPTRGEGWGRPHIEAMAMGLPVVATNWSGLTEFVHAGVGYPLRYTHLAPIPDGAFRGHLQAEADVADLRRIMMHLAGHPDEARAVGRAARREVETQFTPGGVARYVEMHVRRIQGVLERRWLAQAQAEATAR